MPQILADAEHSLTKATAQRMMSGAKTDREKLEHLFLFRTLDSLPDYVQYHFASPDTLPDSIMATR